MKLIHLLLLVALFLHAAAQSGNDTQRLLRDGSKQAFNILVPPPPAEQDEVRVPANALLDTAVAWRSDGTAIANCTHPSISTRVEWNKLRLTRVTRSVVNESDRLNGVTRRYSVLIATEAHRQWDRTTNAWTRWRSSGFVWFPSMIEVEERNGVLVAIAPLSSAPLHLCARFHFGIQANWSRRTSLTAAPVSRKPAPRRSSAWPQTS